MQSSIDNGGFTHIKYGHFYYPRLIQAVCPFCSRPSLLTNIDAPVELHYFIDAAPFRLSWNFRCDNCFRRKIFTWDETKNIELLLKVSIRNKIIWAWNRNHLNYLIGLFSDNENINHDWAFYKNYINKDWFKKTKNKSDLNKLIELYRQSAT